MRKTQKTSFGRGNSAILFTGGVVFAGRPS